MKTTTPAQWSQYVRCTLSHERDGAQYEQKVTDAFERAIAVATSNLETRITEASELLKGATCNAHSPNTSVPWRRRRDAWLAAMESGT